MSSEKSKTKWIDLTKAIIAYVLALYFILYGLGKMLGFQLNGISQQQLHRPLGEVNQFFIAWYLFSSSQIFKILIGILQLISSVLLIVPKTRVVGALFFLPLITAIFIINLSFSIAAFPLSLALLAGDLLLIYLNRKKVIAALVILIK